jgi:hypothetical protein
LSQAYKRPRPSHSANQLKLFVGRFRLLPCSAIGQVVHTWTLTALSLATPGLNRTSFAMFYCMTTSNCQSKKDSQTLHPLLLTVGPASLQHASWYLCVPPPEFGSNNIDQEVQVHLPMLKYQREWSKVRDIWIKTRQNSFAWNQGHSTDFTIPVHDLTHPLDYQSSLDRTCSICGSSKWFNWKEYGVIKNLDYFVPW